MRNALSFEQFSRSQNALSNVNNPGVLCPCRVLQFVSQEYASFFKISFIVVVGGKFLRFAVNSERGSPSVRASNIFRFLVISFREVISLTVVRVRGGRSGLTISAGFFSKWFFSSFQRNNQRLSLNPFPSFDEWLIYRLRKKLSGLPMLS